MQQQREKEESKMLIGVFNSSRDVGKHLFDKIPSKPNGMSKELDMSLLSKSKDQDFSGFAISYHEQLSALSAENIYRRHNSGSG